MYVFLERFNNAFLLFALYFGIVCVNKLMSMGYVGSNFSGALYFYGLKRLPKRKNSKLADYKLSEWEIARKWIFNLTRDFRSAITMIFLPGFRWLSPGIAKLTRVLNVLNLLKNDSI